MTLNDHPSQYSFSTILKENRAQVLNDWVKEQLNSAGKQYTLKEKELREECEEFLQHFAAAIERGNMEHIHAPNWQTILKQLTEISTRRSEQGFSPSETALFVFSFKKPVFHILNQTLKHDTATLVEATWNITYLLDQLGLYTTEVYQKSREEVIARQQQDMLELSTPVVSLADGILALPLIGTLDSIRAQIVMESLLKSIVDTGSTVAIIDITGVPTVDTLVAQHLLKTVTAARLMGADCIISGIRPQIAQTIVHLGVELHNISTKATLSSAFKAALERLGMRLTRTKPDARTFEGQ